MKRPRSSASSHGAAAPRKQATVTAKNDRQAAMKAPVKRP